MPIFMLVEKKITGYFKGGIGTDCFKAFEREGFEVVVKGKNNDPIAQLINDYKKRIKETKLEDEVYKWELLNKYKGRPNVEAADFDQEIKEVKFDNLVYAMTHAVNRDYIQARTRRI